uniref:EF-hand domain-containing protein n=1 Tax=Anopheles funestus TaxID=62324 RepID=A0A182RI88_ANOFN
MASLGSNHFKQHKTKKATKRTSSNPLNNLPQHQITELCELFRLIDTNNKGVIEREDVRTMLTLWNDSAPTEIQLDEMLSDACGVGLNQTLFLTLFAQRLKEVDPPETIKNAFQCIDIENMGTVNAQELRDLLVTKGEHRLTDTEVDELFSRMTINDGRLEYDAFTRMLQNCQNNS